MKTFDFVESADISSYAENSVREFYNKLELSFPSSGIKFSPNAKNVKQNKSGTAPTISETRVKVALTAENGRASVLNPNSLFQDLNWAIPSKAIRNLYISAVAAILILSFVLTFLFQMSPLHARAFVSATLITPSTVIEGVGSGELITIKIHNGFAKPRDIPWRAQSEGVILAKGNARVDRNDDVQIYVPTQGAAPGNTVEIDIDSVRPFLIPVV